MTGIGKFSKRLILVAGIAMMTFSTSGCIMGVPLIPISAGLFGDFSGMVINYVAFWKTTPFLPISAYFSQQIEDTYWEEERYGKVPILDPVEGEHAPLFCLDPPSPDEVIRSLPDEAAGGFAFLAETSRNNVRIVVEPIVDKIEECRFYPLAGPARLHKCHYKCTVYYDKAIRSEWPIPFTHTDLTQEVVYIDHDHLIRCAGPAMPR